MVLFGMIWCGLVWFGGLVCFVSLWFGLAWFGGLVWLVWFGVVSYGMVRRDVLWCAVVCVVWCGVASALPKNVFSLKAILADAPTLGWARGRWHRHKGRYTEPYHAEQNTCGVVWCSVVWSGVVWFGVLSCGLVWFGVGWCGLVWFGVVWCGVVWFVVWFGVVWCDLVWFCLV